MSKCGLYLFECGYLGSTPDGLITSNNEVGRGVLEVKCPWKYRSSTVENMKKIELRGKQENKQFCLNVNDMLVKGHNYWHQVQAEMAAVNVEWAHFVIWTQVDCKIVLVKRDWNWFNNNVPKLSEFYINHLIPHYCCV